MGDDQGAVPLPLDVLEQFLEHDHLAGTLEIERADDVESLVEHDLLAAAKLVHLDVGGHRHAQLPPAVEDVDRPVVVRGQEHAVPTRRLREPVDLLLERQNLVAGLAERDHQLLVLARELGHHRLRLPQPILERAQVAWRLGQLAPQHQHFLLEERDLRRELLCLLLEPGGPALVRARRLLRPAAGTGACAAEGIAPGYASRTGHGAFTSPTVEDRTLNATLPVCPATSRPASGQLGRSAVTVQSVPRSWRLRYRAIER